MGETPKTAELYLCTRLSASCEPNFGSWWGRLIVSESQYNDIHSYRCYRVLAECFIVSRPKQTNYQHFDPAHPKRMNRQNWPADFQDSVFFFNFTTTTLTPLSLNICIFTSPSFTVWAHSMLLTDDVFGHRFSMLFGHGHLMFVHAVWRSDLTIRNYQSHHPPFSHPLNALLQLLLDFVV